MSHNQVNTYGVDRHIAEIYDRVESESDDISLIRCLIGVQNSHRILEPFCGTGRILIPLAIDGHSVCGIDRSQLMLDAARRKINKLPKLTQSRITILESNVVTEAWPVGFDIVILACNCFYELASPVEQRRCVQFAAQVLKPGGFVFIDNDHMEGELDPAWQVREKKTSPLSGTCEDGTRVESTLEPIWFDARKRLVKFRRQVIVTTPAGVTTTTEFIQQKHPVSTTEVKQWLEQAGFSILKHMGDDAGNPYQPGSRRSIFWAQLMGRSNGKSKQTP